MIRPSRAIDRRPPMKTLLRGRSPSLPIFQATVVSRWFADAPAASSGIQSTMKTVRMFFRHAGVVTSGRRGAAVPRAAMKSAGKGSVSRRNLEPYFGRDVRDVQN